MSYLFNLNYVGIFRLPQLSWQAQPQRQQIYVIVEGDLVPFQIYTVKATLLLHGDLWAISFAPLMETERLFSLVFAILIFFVGANCIKFKR